MVALLAAIVVMHNGVLDSAFSSHLLLLAHYHLRRFTFISIKTPSQVIFIQGKGGKSNLFHQFID